MDLLVTGASGFIGRNLMRALQPGWRVWAVYHASTDFPEFCADHRLDAVVPIRCDLTSLESTRGMASRMPAHFDAIVHLAANGDPARSVADPMIDLITGTGSLVTLLSVFTTNRLIYFSSGAVYDGLKGPVDPDTPVQPTLPYAVSKLACEQYLRFFRKTGRIGGFVTLRFFGAYGPYEPARKIYSRLVRWAAATPHEPFEIRGDGSNLIDAMYVSDLVRAVAQVLVSPVSDVVVDFGSGEPTTINELVTRAGHVLTGRAPHIRHVGSVPEYIEFSVSSERMARLFDFRPTVPLEEGLMRLRDHLTTPEAVR